MSGCGGICILKWGLSGLLFSVAVSAKVWAADPACVKSAATLRKGPGSDKPVSWKVPQFMPFLKVDYKGSWSKVEDLDGEAHWIKTNELTAKFRCVVVKSNVATLRQGPSPSAPLAELRSVDRYTPFKRLANEKDWVQVEDETGRKAWIHESLVWKPVTVSAITF